MKEYPSRLKCLKEQGRMLTLNFSYVGEKVYYEFYITTKEKLENKSIMEE